MGIVFALIAALQTAAADPLALRTPGQTWSLAAGAPTLSAGAWWSDQWGAAINLRTSGSALGAAVGARRRLLGDADRWGLDGYLAAGISAPLIEPAAAITLTPSVRVRRRGERTDWGVAVSAPAAGRVTGGWAHRIPVMLEPSVSVRLGGLRVGAMVGLGAAFNSGGPITYEQQAALLISGEG
ncbi:MAG: hypothetical protein AAFV53_34390 [Myxococcota bacterium]